MTLILDGGAKVTLFCMAIRDFKSLDRVPKTIDDWRAGRTIEVTPDDLRVVYVAK